MDGIRPLCLSSPYQTEPVGMDSKNWFTNAVGKLETSLSPSILLDRLLKLEIQFGRHREASAIKKHQDRLLDLDILLFGDMIIEDSDLVLPHPEMDRRLFVLVPLAEISPACFHPLLEQTASQMLSHLTRQTNQQEISKVFW